MNERERDILKKILVDPFEIAYCPLPIFSAFPLSLMEKAEARSKFQLPSDKKLLLFFGIIRPYKGLMNLIKAVGIYVLIRLFFNMFIISNEMAVLITSLGALSMAAGVFLAIGQWDIKRLLAYHSISQMGYVILSMGIGMILIARGSKPEIAALAIAGGLFHLINHAAFKSLLFLNAGAIEYRTGTRNLKEMGGLAGQMPATSATSFIASMSISGIPPFNGFFSKLIIIIAAVMAKFYLLALLAVIVSIITLASFMKFQRYAFFNKTDDRNDRKIKEVPFPMLFSMIVLGIICLLLSMLALPGIRETILTPATDILMDPSKYPSQITGI